MPHHLPRQTDPSLNYIMVKNQNQAKDMLQTCGQEVISNIGNGADMQSRVNISKKSKFHLDRPGNVTAAATSVMPMTDSWIGDDP
jgi:hypothetical protein